MKRAALGVLLAAASAFAAAIPQEPASSQPWFKLPPQPPPELFGNLLIDRGAASAKVKPVVFSHWSHRLRYTCRVCHLELDFALKRNGTGITEEASRGGAYCGACHDGKTAFGHTEANCPRCHTGEKRIPEEGLARLAGLPRAKFGNGVDWSAALSSGRIAPADTLSPGPKRMTLDRTVSLEAEWAMVPPAVFSHAEHTLWLDCANCHPAVFNIKKKTTRHFSMKAILAGEFCGACHLDVAFPLDDCKRCHPKIKDY